MAKRNLTRSATAKSVHNTILDTTPLRASQTLLLTILSHCNVTDMSFVLCIDFSCTPCEVSLSEVSAARVEVIKHVACEISALADPAKLASEDLRNVLAELRGRKRAANDIPTESRAEFKQAESALQSLREAISQLEPIWTSCVVVVPQDNFVALNLDLPFGESKTLEPIVDLEVQDVIPFDLDEFFIQYSLPAIQNNGIESTTSKTRETISSGAGPFDVHVGLLPRNTVSNTLDICKSVGVEPSVITVPSSAIGAIIEMIPTASSTNSAILFNRGDYYSLAMCIDGKARLERSIIASKNIAHVTNTNKETSLTQIFTTIRLAIAAAERKYSTKIEKVILLGREVKEGQGEKAFQRPLEGISFRDLLGTQATSSSVAPLAAVYAHEDAITSPLSNFRSRQFSFTPKLSEFFRALLGVRRVALRACIATVVALAVIYLSRQYHISSISTSLIEQINGVIPGFNPEPHAIASELSSRRQALADELASFGTYSNASPAAYLTTVLQSLPSNNTVTLDSLLIKKEMIRIEGTASALSAIEEYTQALGTHTDIFNKLDYKPQNSPRGGFTFSISIQLPE